MKMFELKHLKTLDSLATTHSLTKTAQSLFMTDSALSHQLKELEKRLGGVLFERKTSPIRFTDKGQLLLDLAAKILPLVNQTQQALNQNGLSQIRIGVECHACFAWILPTLKAFKQQFEHFAVDFTNQSVFCAADTLRRKQADVVFTSDKTLESDINFTAIGEFEMVLVTAVDHPLAKQNFVTAQDLATQTLLTYPVDTHRLDIFRFLLQPAAVQPQQVRQVDQANVLVQMVAADMGVAALPLWAVKQYQQNNLIATVALGESGLQRPLFAAFRQQDQQDHHLLALLQLSQKQFEKLSTK
jgi:LysR family transcriptional regulator for metE and metH